MICLSSNTVLVPQLRCREDIPTVLTSINLPDLRKRRILASGVLMAFRKC